MAGQYKTLKDFQNLGGLDVSSSDLLRSKNSATEIKNVDYRKTGALNKRLGTHCRADALGGCGMSDFADVDNTTGTVTNRGFVLDSTLREIETETLSITYSGANDAYVSVYAHTDGNFYLDLYDNYVRVLNQNLSNGINDSAAITLGTLITNIIAIADFTASASGITTEPAAFLEPIRDVDLMIGTPSTLEYQALTAVTSSVVGPFSVAQVNKDNADFENASFTQLNNVLYISTGYDELYKFDGTSLFRAGMPLGIVPTVATGVAGALTGNYYYKVTYEMTDAKGNIVEGIISDLSTVVAPVAEKVDVTVTNLLTAAAAGWATTSSDLKINIWRTMKDPATPSIATFYLVTTLTNDGANATTVYADNTTDSALGPEYVIPIKAHGLPPQGKYITSFRSQILIAGKRDDVNTVFYSDIDSPEYFPAVDNSFLVETTVGDVITGIAPYRNSVYIFKTFSIHDMSGDIGTDRIRTDLVSRERIGCVANATIQEVTNGLQFLSDTGVYNISDDTKNGISLVEVSKTINNKFNANTVKFNFKKAVAFNWTSKDKYMLFMPEETLASSEYYNNNNSRVFTHDYARNAWLEWTNLDFGGGISLVNSDVFFTKRLANILGGSIPYTFSFLDNGDTFDYADHNEAIEFTYKSHWETMGEPSVFKKFLRVKVHGLDTSVEDFESDTFNLDVASQHDFINSNISSFNLDFSGSSEGWGVSAWDEFAWGDMRLNSKRGKLRSTKCKALRMIFNNAVLHQNVLISGYEIEVVTPYEIEVQR